MKRYLFQLSMALIYSLLLIGLSMSTAFATTVKRMTTRDLVKTAHMIITGKVISNETLSDPGPTNVRTLTRIAVHQALKGQVGTEITVTGMGGIVGNLAFNWPGVPRFKEGEEVLLFLERDPSGPTIVSGLEQGRFTIATDPRGKKFITRNLADLTLVGGKGGSIFLTGKMSLENYQKEINAILNE